MSRRVLVTAALTYANGSPHLGHLLEAIQTDVYARARKLAGEDVIFMWAADTHGTPISLRARKEGIAPEELIAKAHADHLAVYSGFGLGFDIYYTTHSPETQRHSNAIYEALKAKGHIETRVTKQLYCPNDKMFLPDRFVKGQCPKCGSPDQYGDSCEKCGSTYAPTDLKEPRCSICGTTPVLADSEHLFVALARHEAFLREWLKSPEEGGKTRLQPTVRNYVMRWVDDGLRDWDISRDAPYFGFPIPGYEGENKKYFYVWFDAPVGYIGATQKWSDEHGRDAASYWRQGGDAEIVHVIGKDIVYFHCLFWPAMLHAADYMTPSRVQVHGWLTVNGEKMSKARGTFILGRTYLEHLSADYLRYYFAAKLGAAQDDIDLSMEDFANRVDADLVAKAANLASRCAKFINGRLGGRLGEPAADAAPLLARARERLREAPGLYREFESAKALRLAIEIAEELNKYLTETAPWVVVKTDPERARAICTAGLHASIMIAAIFAPVLPGWAEKTERMLKLDRALDLRGDVPLPPAGHAIGEYEDLAVRIDPAKLAAIVEASKETLHAPESAPAHDYEVEALTAEATIDVFKNVDLRVGKIVECAAVKGSDKLLQLKVDLGPLGQRNVFSGIALSYKPDQLVGKHVVVFANLKPRKMRFGMSEGMILAAGASDDAVTVLELDPRSRPGDRVT